MLRAEHIKSIAEKFDKEIAREYEWVHDWLDGCVAKGISLKKHRQYRHHEKGLKELEIFSQSERPDANLEIVLKVARQHIIDEGLLQSVWVKTVSIFYFWQTTGQYFQSQVLLISDAIGASLQNTYFIVQSLDKTKRNLVFQLAISGYAAPVFFNHLRKALIRL
jgi:hypothetical protein